MLSDILTKVIARFTALGITAPILVGKRFLAQQSSVSRIVVVPSDDTFAAPRALNASPKQLLTRSAGAEVHVYGVTADLQSASADLLAIAAGEVLLHAFIRELRGQTYGQRTGMAVRSGSWTTAVKDLVHGAEYVLKIAVDVQVEALPNRSLAGATTLEATASIPPGATPEDVPPAVGP